MNILLAILFFIVLPEDKIKIKDPWMRPGAKQMGTALYFAIENNGEAADTLYKVESDIAGRVELHETYSNGDVMGMRKVEMIIVEAGSSFELKPGAHHIMVMRLKKDIKRGDEAQFNLFFSKTGEINIKAVAK
jgi:copper(I)-binding protein